MMKPWGGAGAWAAESEQAEAEAKAKGSAYPGGAPPEAFPSLVEAVAKQPKKKKQQVLSYAEFTTGKYIGPGSKPRALSDARGLTADEQMMLPTGPRDRTGEENDAPGGGLGGGFRDYGGGFRGGDRGGDRGDRESRDRSFGGGFDRDRDGGRMGKDRDPRDDGPSRADEADNWGASKKTLPSSYQPTGGGGGYDEDRRGGRLSDRDAPSRADEVDHWGSTKKFVPSLPADSFDRRGRGGFEERRGGGGFEEGPGGVSRADEVDNWGAAKKFVPSSAPPVSRGGGGGFDGSYRDAGSESDRWSRRDPLPRDDMRPAERPRLVLQRRSIPLESQAPPPAAVNGATERPNVPITAPTTHESDALLEQQPPPKPKPRSNPFGAARPREEVLAEKGQDWRKLDADLDVKDKEKYSRPSSSHSSRSSRPQTPEVGVEQGGAKLRPKLNPFGEAKREAFADEKGGRDWGKFEVGLEDRIVHGAT